MEKRVIVRKNFVTLSAFIKMMEDCYMDVTDCVSNREEYDFCDIEFVDFEIKCAMHFYTENSVEKINCDISFDRHMRLTSLWINGESKVVEKEKFRFDISGMESVFEFLQSFDLKAFIVSQM